MILKSNISEIEKKIISRINRFQISKQDHNELLKFFSNKNILVLGAAGSIGYKFTEQLTKNFYVFKNLYLIDKNENELTDLNRNLILKNFQKKIYYLCLDIINFDLDKFIKNNKINVLINFAAVKHVRSEENYYSTRYMFQTNSINFLPKKKYSLQKVFSVSTDKTVNPKSILGISKNLMEKNLINYGFKNNVFVSTTRFANVSFSNGSILKYIYERLIQRKKFGLPDKIRRYFITHEEASSLCMKSLLNRYRNKIIIPSPKILGKDFLIKDLAKKIASILKIEIKFFKNKKHLFSKNNRVSVLLTKPYTHGQKINEELFSIEEKIIFDHKDKTIIIAQMPNVDNSLNEYLKKIMSEKNLIGIRKLIKKNYKQFPFKSKFNFLSKTL
tara:strand:- start:1578 stop:2738 length:1161 start_codon:yes stop_codon:yes gene_type:complete